jgi:hypothetical protein
VQAKGYFYCQTAIMASPNAQKLKIKKSQSILTLNAPTDYKKSLGDLPADVKITDSGKAVSQVHWFVKDRAQLEKELKKVLPLIKDDTLCWIFYPKGTSKIQTDLTRDKGWDELRKTNLQWINLISFDETWSAFGLREKKNTEITKELNAKERPILAYIDPGTKTLVLPEDFAGPLQKHKKAEAFFNTLSFTNRKEWVEWIVTAKREETRTERVKASVERLAKQWKNPANR